MATKSNPWNLAKKSLAADERRDLCPDAIARKKLCTEGKAPAVPQISRLYTALQGCGKTQC
jgi:hypothetical protein